MMNSKKGQHDVTDGSWFSIGPSLYGNLGFLILVLVISVVDEIEKLDKEKKEEYWDDD